MRAPLFLATAMALVMATSACSSSEPSLSTAAAELQKDMRRLEADDVFKNPLHKLRILQRADKDILCDKGKFKRVMRATADYKRIDEPLDDHLDRSQNLMENTLVRALGYKVEFDFSQGDAEEGRFIYGVKQGLGVKVAVFVSPEAPTWRLHVQTACLSR